MTEAEWLARDDPNEMTEFLKDRITARKARLLGCACVRYLSWPWLVDERSTSGIEISERFADGLVNEAELALAKRNAFNAAEELQAEGDEFYQPAARILWALAAELGRNLMPASWAGVVGSERIRDIFGNPFRPVAFSPEWRTGTALTLARTMYDQREFSAMPILADALQDAGCDNQDILTHCREGGTHVRGCWVVDLVLGKE